MSTQAVSYRGPLQTFTFEENSKRTEVIDHSDQTVRVLSAQFPVYPEDLKDGASVMVLKRMFGNGFYPYVSDGVVKFGEGLPGGMLRSGSAAAAAAAIPADPYIPRDWSQPPDKITQFETRCTELIGIAPNRFATIEGNTFVLWNRDGRLKTISCDGPADMIGPRGSIQTEIRGLRPFPGNRLGILVTECLDAEDAYREHESYEVYNSEGKCECSFRLEEKGFFCRPDHSGDSGDTSVWSTSLEKANKAFNGLSVALEDSFEWAVLHRYRHEYSIWSLEGSCKQKIMIQGEAKDTLLGMDSFMRLRNKDFLCSGSYKIIIFSPQGEVRRVIEESDLCREVCELQDGAIAWLSIGTICSKLKICTRDGEYESISLPARGSIDSFSELKDGNLALCCEGGRDKKGFVQICNRQGKILTTFSESYSKLGGVFQFEDGVLAVYNDGGPISIWQPKSMRTAQADTAGLEAQFQQQLADLMQTTQASIREMQARYEAEGRARFEKMIKEQEAAFQASIEARTSALSAEWAEGQASFYQRALQEVSKGASLSSLSDAQLSQVRAELSRAVGPRLQGELQSLMRSHSYQTQMQQLQQTVLDEIQKRQGHLLQEMIHTQNEQSCLRDRQGVLWNQYETKQKKLQEQQALQNPPSVRAFYNATEKHFSAHLMSAMMLVSGMITRTETRLEVGAKAGGKVAEMLCGSIPLVGSVAGSLLSFGIEAGAGYVAERKEESARQNVFDSAVRFKDAMMLAELAARRVTQGFLEHLQTTSCEDAEAGGKEAAQIMYDYMQEGHLQTLSARSAEEKIAALVKAVADRSQKTKGILGRKKGKVFERPVEMTTASTRQVTKVSEDVQGLQKKLELAQKHQQVTATRIRSIAEEGERQRALAALKAKDNFTRTSFTITRAKKELKINCSEKDVLRKVVSSLTRTFHSDIIDDCDIEEDTLNVTTTSSICAKELQLILEQWLNTAASS